MGCNLSAAIAPATPKSLALSAWGNMIPGILKDRQLPEFLTSEVDELWMKWNIAHASKFVFIAKNGKNIP